MTTDNTINFIHSSAASPTFANGSGHNGWNNGPVSIAPMSTGAPAWALNPYQGSLNGIYDVAMECSQHEAGELYEYVDGTIYVHCVTCQERVKLTAIPAWGSPKQLENIIEELAEGFADPELALHELLSVEEKLEAALEEILRAQSLLDIAKRMALGIHG